MEYLIAFIIGLFIFRFLKNSILSLASIPPEIDTDDVIEISQSFLCNKCGTQLTVNSCLLYTSPSPRDATLSRMPSSA